MYDGKMVLSSFSVTIEMNATNQYFPVVVFIRLYKIVVAFVTLDANLKGDHSNEIYRAVVSCDTVYYAVQGSSNF